MAEPEKGSPAEPDAVAVRESNVDVGQLTQTDSAPALNADDPDLSGGAEWQKVTTESSETTNATKDMEPVNLFESVADSANRSTDSNASEEKADPESAEQHDESDDVRANGTAGAGQGPAADQADTVSVRGHDLATDTRMRSDSRSTTATFATHRSAPVSSTVFIVTALETIGASKDARKSKELDEAVKDALANIKQSDRQPINPETIFRPLQLATKSFSIPLQVTALDCIGKLITYSYFAFPSGGGADGEAPAEQPPLIERAIDAICDCFENEATPNEIQQQIIKSLLAAVLNDKIVVHGAGLLKAVRQIYNIFIFSKSNQNQQVAQGSLTQMVGTVFDRVRMRIDLKELRMRDGDKFQGAPSEVTNLDGGDAADTPETNDQDQESDAASVVPSDRPVPKQPTEKMTLQSFESTKEEAPVNDNAPTTVTRARAGHSISRSVSGALEDRGDADAAAEDDLDEVYVKDAFLVFRALCKLSHKILSHDQQQDIKSQNMRTKLLSLHLIHHLINNHVAVLTSPLATMRTNSNSADATTLLQAVRPLLCLSLSRNGASSVPRVFEVCCEIFWLMLKHMRVMMKKELEVFMKEIYLAILEKRNAPSFQKQYFMEVLERLADDPRALVEMYLNYDCDRTALENIYQNIIEQLSRYSSAPASATAIQQQQFQESHAKISTIGVDWHQRGTLPPSLATASIGNAAPPPQQLLPPEYILKQQALECLVGLLRSLDSWGSQRLLEPTTPIPSISFQKTIEESRDSLDTSVAAGVSTPGMEGLDPATGQSTPTVEDDPNEIEKVKQRKTALLNAIQQFNFKPKRGIKLFLQEGFIRSDAPEEVASFLLRNDRLDKAMIGEYLGEGDAENIAIMHAFVDAMDFTKRRFTDALRQFLQHFRLPGEAQKIDRFMLKFAERYVTQNPNAFANADTAYVLAYSVIMLNTDQHSSKLKGRRMTKEDFIKNNRGINDNQDLPDEYLGSIFDEIASNEIVLDTEREHAANMGRATSSPSGLASRAGQVLSTVGRDIQGERYAQASVEMANKTEQLYRSLIRAQRRTAVKQALSRFIPATSVKHVGSMFNVTWMSFLSGLSAPMQDTQNVETMKLCMEGIKVAIRISCAFDLETPRVAFVTALAKFTNLGNVREMMPKNVEALKVLLDVALTEGNHLKSSWREILTCVSQLDRLQLLTDGVDEGALPDVSRARIVPQAPPSGDTSRRSMQVRRPRPRSVHGSAAFRSEAAMESRSSEMVRGVDRIFTNTANLSHEAIICFVRALSEVSWQEIQSSGQSESPRTYSLQKLVEISYYNMTRVRIEWSKIWEILGQHFNQVGCHSNTTVVFFALDSLRQLSMRFMEIEELPGFKFQKDFLKPFEHVMANSSTVAVKDMILRCLIQMIQARGDNIRSGWKTMFGVFTVAAREPYEGIVNMAMEHVTQIYETRFGVLISQGAFADLVVCLTEFSKNIRFQKKSLQAIEMLKSTIPKMLRTPECPLSHHHGAAGGPQDDATVNLSKQMSRQSQEEQFWYPILIAFQDVLMTGDDLEVRSRALTYLFDTLIRYGGDFPPEFWDVLWRQLLYPIFVVLQSKSEMSKVPNHEELSVWLSTTMIQALRNMITLFTHYFDSLQYMLDRVLELLTLCICQENDTIARIGSNCLQQLILQNVTKFDQDHWTKIVGAFVELFDKTTAYDLFTAAASIQPKPTDVSKGANGEAPSDEAAGGEVSAMPSEDQGHGTLTRTNGDASGQAATPDAELPTTSAHNPELEDYRPQTDLQQQQPAAVTAARRRFFNRIITNCVLQLLMIETVHELFSNDNVYAEIPSHELLRLMTLLKKSYQFAKKFNEDKELRMQLWRQGFMKQPPNLLKQESGSAATYVHILFRMYHDERDERKASRADTEAALIPLCADIIRSFTGLDEETQHRNIVAWRPVVVDVIDGYTNLPQDGFEKHIETFYPLGVDLLGRDVNAEIRSAIQSLFRRIGEVKFGIAPLPSPEIPSSRRSSVSQQYFNVPRKYSRGGR